MSREPGPLRVVVADDQALERAGFRMMLEADPGIPVVGDAADGEEAVSAVLQPPLSAARMRRVASSPSSTGIRTSIITTSGRCRRGRTSSG
jgi:DNA-binding NarL/FixJ family response regulator